MQSIPDNDPAMLLYNQYYYHSQRWCEETISLVMEKLCKNEYPTHIFVKLLIVLQRLVDLGFDTNILENAHKQMIQNVKTSGFLKTIRRDPLLHDDEKFRKKINSRISEINDAINERNSSVMECSIGEILKKEDWATRLYNIVPNLIDRLNQDFCVFCKADAGQWLHCIVSSPPEQLDIFRASLGYAYPVSNLRVCRNYRDIPVLQELFDGLDPDQARDLIVKANLKMIKDQLKSIIGLYKDPNDEEHTE